VAAGRSVDSDLDRVVGSGGRPKVGIQFAPNQEGTTDPSYLIDFVERLEDNGESSLAILDAMSEEHATNSNRYFFTDTYGWVDIRHFAAAAGYAASTGSVVAEALGFGNEAAQWLTEWEDDYRSGFSPEDIPSNAAGAEFGDDYLSEEERVSASLQQWMADHGARGQNHPLAGRAALPATDPAVRGGGARGSSNVSRTQISVAEQVARPLHEIGNELSKALDWRNWYRLAHMR
jgi:hypothetical protein